MKQVKMCKKNFNNREKTYHSVREGLTIYFLICDFLALEESFKHIQLPFITKMDFKQA